MQFGTFPNFLFQSLPCFFIIILYTVKIVIMIIFIVLFPLDFSAISSSPLFYQFHYLFFNLICLFLRAVYTSTHTLILPQIYCGLLSLRCPYVALSEKIVLTVMVTASAVMFVSPPYLFSFSLFCFFFHFHIISASFFFFCCMQYINTLTFHQNLLLLIITKLS